MKDNNMQQADIYRAYDNNHILTYTDDYISSKCVIRHVSALTPTNDIRNVQLSVEVELLDTSEIFCIRDLTQLKYATA